MRQKRDPVPRARDAWVWLGGTMLLGLLGAGVTAAAVLLWENVDIRQLTPGLAIAAPAPPSPESPRAAAAPGGTFRAVFYESRANRDFSSDPDAYERELDLWREAVTGAGGLVSSVDDPARLESLDAAEVLVLLESPCLSDRELAAIRAHRDDGGSVVANWAVGARDGTCAWRGWAPLLDFAEAESVREIAAGADLHLTVPGGIALSPGLDAGTRIDLRTDPSIAVRRVGAHAYWSDWALNPDRGPQGGAGDVAAVARRTETGARLVWLGFRLGQAASERDSVAIGRLARNGVLWAAGLPSAGPATWPGGARAAMVFSLDVEDRWENAAPVARLFEAEGIPGTFFVVSQPVQDEESLADALTRAGEVGSQTSDHTPLGGLTAQDQAVRMRRSWSEIERWTGSGPAGLRPPEELVDESTLLGWRMAGGEYVLVRNGRSASPEIHATPRGPVVLLPRLLKDDFNVIVQDGAMRAERIAESFVRGSRKLHAIGGLAVVAGHTQIMQSDARRNAYAVAAREARSSGGWWLARGDEVARWWLARDGVEIGFGAPPTPEGEEPTTLEAPPTPEANAGTTLWVRAPADRPVPELWIDVTVPAPPGPLRPTVDGRAVDFEDTGWGVRIPVGTLEPGATRIIELYRPPRADVGPEGG